MPRTAGIDVAARNLKLSAPFASLFGNLTFASLIR